MLPLKVRPEELWPRPGLSAVAARERLEELPPWSLEDEPEVSRQGRERDWHQLKGNLQRGWAQLRGGRHLHSPLHYGAMPSPCTYPGEQKQGAPHPC